MNQEVFYNIIKNNPSIAMEEIESFSEFCNENNIRESDYGFYIWLLDKDSHKILFKGVMSLNSGDGKMKKIVAKTILENPLLLKAMGGDLPGDFIPSVIMELYYNHDKVHFEKEQELKWANFTYTIIPHVALSSLKIIKSKNMLEVNEYIGGYGKDKFIEEYYDLLKEDCNTSLINAWLSK